MDNRLRLHNVLISILGVKKVYYQPPESVKLEYPCIIYELSNIFFKYANDDKYLHNNSYTVTLIDSDPDSTIVDEILKLPFISFDRHFTSDNLNHFVFTIHN